MALADIKPARRDSILSAVDADKSNEWIQNKYNVSDYELRWLKAHRTMEVNRRKAMRRARVASVRTGSAVSVPSDMVERVAKAINRGWHRETILSKFSITGRQYSGYRSAATKRGLISTAID